MLENMKESNFSIKPMYEFEKKILDVQKKFDELNLKIKELEEENQMLKNTTFELKSTLNICKNLAKSIVGSDDLKSLKIILSTQIKNIEQTLEQQQEN